MEVNDPWGVDGDSTSSPPAPRSTTEPGTLAAWIEDRSGELERRYRTDDFGNSHIPTGLRRLDEAGLLEPGIVTTLLAAAGEGKSAWSFQFLRGAASAGFPCLGLFPEDPKAMLVDRLLSTELDVSSFALRRGKAGRDVADRLGSVRLDWARLVDVDDARYSHGALWTRMTEWMKRNRRGLIVCDYVQAVLGKLTGKSKEETISDWVWECGEAAKEYGVAILLLSQVRGEVMERGRKNYDNWRWKNPEARECPDEAVAGFCPAAYDGAHAPTALYQKSRCVLTAFRPGHWKRQMGWNAKDDVMVLHTAKNNYSAASSETMRFRWDGGRILEK